MDDIYYRIMEKRCGKFYSLFHGTQGSREIPPRVWLDADIKKVRDGSGDKYYTSGFHLLRTYDEAVLFFDRHFRIRENRVIVIVQASGIRRKEKSREEVLLADRMMLLGEAA